MSNQTPKTIGEQRVRIDFNPSNSDPVYQVKHVSADMINVAEKVKEESADPEVKRLAALASTAYEEAALWLVKALTAGK